MIHTAWTFAAAAIVAGLGIWLLLSPHSSTLRQLGAVLAAIGAIATSTQMPRMESLWADSAFMSLSAVLLTTAVATTVSRHPLRCAVCFFVALAAMSALLLLAGIGFVAVLAVTSLFALVPGGFIFAFERESLRSLSLRQRLRGRHRLDDANTGDPPNTHPRPSQNFDLPAWEPLLCVASGMALAGVLAMAVHAACAGNDAIEQLSAARLQNYLTLAGSLMGVGLCGFLSRRSLFVMLLSAQVILMGIMLGWTAGYHVCDCVVGQGALAVLELAATGQSLVALVAIYAASRGREKPAEAGTVPGGTNRGEALAMVAGLLILIGMLLL